MMVLQKAAEPIFHTSPRARLLICRGLYIHRDW